MGEKLKGFFPHKLNYDVDLCLEKKHFYKRDHNELKNYEK